MVQESKDDRTGISVMEGWGDACQETWESVAKPWGASVPEVFEERQGHHGWEECTGEGRRACVGGKGRGNGASQDIWGHFGFCSHCYQNTWMCIWTKLS